MFRGHRRKVRILFGLLDILIVGLAFELAYLTRARMDLARTFFLTPAESALLMGVSMVAWVGLGYWWELYDRIDSAHPRVILRDTFRQCLVGVASLILFEYLDRMDLRRPIVALFAGYACVILCLVRLHSGVTDEVIFEVDSRRLAELEEILLLCDEEGVRTRVAVDFFPHVNSQVYLDRLGASPLLTFSATPHDEIRLLMKRLTDIALAAAWLILLFPVMLAIVLLIRLTSPGPAIFRQERCGLNGRRFVFYKFRSMCDNAEELKASLAHLSHKQTAFKIRNDPRLTGVGRFLRKFSIDEWPQLWNVLKGDMSLVGPRPAVPEEVEHYQTWQRRRLRMRPGLTCLWAVKGRDSLDFDTWMKMDMQYIDTWSLALDWKIILRTIPRVLTGRGAY